MAISWTMVLSGRIHQEIATGLAALAMTWLFGLVLLFENVGHRNGSAILRIARATEGRPYGAMVVTPWARL